MVIYRKDMQK